MHVPFGPTAVACADYGSPQTFKRVVEWVGMTLEEIQTVSGHSIRVGATQELLALNIDFASVMQAGRWNTTAMPMRYGEDIQAALGGMARTAKAQGRLKSLQVVLGP
jgi:hypothetical protein